MDLATNAAKKVAEDQWNEAKDRMRPIFIVPQILGAVLVVFGIFWLFHKCHAEDPEGPVAVTATSAEDPAEPVPMTCPDGTGTIVVVCIVGGIALAGIVELVLLFRHPGAAAERYAARGARRAVFGS